MAEFILYPGNIRKRQAGIEAMLKFARGLDISVGWAFTCKRYKKTRSLEQNAYLWGVVYPEILGSVDLDGWTDKDLHEYFLGEHFGWITLGGMGRKRLKPNRRSSKLKTTEFMDYLEFIKERMAQQGVYIPDPNEGEW